MILLGWIIIALLGLSVINVFAYRITVLEKAGFIFPVGMGINSFIMFIMDVMHIPLTRPGLILIANVILVIGLNVIVYIRNKPIRMPELPWKNKTFKAYFKPNLAWVFLMAYTLYVVYAIAVKAMFWPPFIYDSINGYDFLARVIAHEGTFNNTIFNPENPLYSVRSLYPPLVPMNMSFAYLIGSQTSQAVVALFYVSIFVSFYALLKRYTTHLGAVIFSLLLVITPEFAAFSALSSPNPPCTFFSAMSLLCLIVYYKDDNRNFLNLGMILMFFALWTRTETVVFAAAGFLILLLISIKKKKFRDLIIYSAGCAVVFAIWQWYLATVLHVQNAEPIIMKLYWDPGKLSRMWAQVVSVTFKAQFYGWSIYIFLIMIAVNIYFIIKKKDNLMLLGTIFISWLLYIFVYYQIDTDYGPNATIWILAGYKRGLFYFLPLMLFYCGTNAAVSKVFNKWLSL